MTAGSRIWQGSDASSQPEYDLFSADKEKSDWRGEDGSRMTKASSMKTVRGWIHGKQLLRWSGSSLLGLSLLANGTAQAGETVDRLGRLLGVGWSDGYHACAADCYLPGENLPPRSFAADHSLYSRAHSAAASPGHSVHRQHSLHQPAYHHPSSHYSGIEGMIDAGPQLAAPMHHAPAPQTLEPANPEPMYESMVEPPLAPATPQPAPIGPRDDDEDSLLDSPSDVRGPASRVPATGAPSAAPRTAPRAVPRATPAPAATQPPKQSRPRIEQIQPPESDDLLESDDDLLLEELPPPADDSLLPYQYQREYRRLRPAGPVARTSAELPRTRPAATESRPARIGGGTPKRLPMVNSFSPR